VSEFEEPTPPTGEQLHVSRSSWLPVLLAVGLTLALIGVTVSIVFTIIGLLITLPVLVRWIRSAREEMGELPPGH
jgi:Flp pilus assembly protein TadB